MSLPRTFCLSSASAALTPSTSLTTFTNYYAILQLDHWATTEEVKAQFRKLRAEYFASDAGKYRQLQMAYAVLIDWDARREYDVVYRVSMGLPPLAGSAAGLAGRTSEKAAPETDHARGSSAGGAGSPRGSALVRAAVSRIDAQSSKVQEENHRMEMARLEEQLEEQLGRVEEEQRQREEEEEQRLREADPNWGLKHFSPQYEPLIGSRRYSSYVPIAGMYAHSKEKPKSRRPTYIGEMAAKAVP